jgi:hypothetical protein
MSVYPRNMSAFLNRLSGYNKNNVKMNVLGSSSASAGDIIQVDLPTNSIVDLSSLAWSFRNTFSVGADLTDGKKAAAPQNAEAIIERLAIEVNGQTLVNLTNYNMLFHALLYMTATDDYVRSRRVAQTNNSTHTDSGTSKEITGAGGLGGSEVRFHVIDSWLGFLGSAKPNFIDTSLLGNVRITITLAPATIIQNVDEDAAALTSRAYTVDQQYFSIDVVSISDGIYDAMVDQMLASGAPIEVPFKNYFAFTGAAQPGQLAFNVASQSIDRLWGVMRHNTDFARAAHAALPAVATSDKDIPVTTDRAFTYATANATDFQFQVNNTLYPQWSSSRRVDWYQHTKLAVGDQGNMLAGSYVTNPESYIQNYFVYACQLEHRTDGDERFVTGIDTRGAAAQCYWNWKTGSAQYAAFVFAEVTSSMKIFANKVIEVVQ